MARFGKKNKAEEIEQVEAVENDTPVVETENVEKPAVEDLKVENVEVKVEAKTEVVAEVESLADFLF